MENSFGVLLTKEQLNATINLIGSMVETLKVRLAETHSGVDKLLIESAIINAKDLITHYEQFLPEKQTEPDEGGI